jgi:hypothetical protein
VVISKTKKKQSCSNVIRAPRSPSSSSSSLGRRNTAVRLRLFIFDFDFDFESIIKKE